MKLRSPEAFWLLKNGILNSYPSLQENIRCDIAVMGAGITGALISHALMSAGYNTVVIDKRDVGAGSSAATTSMLQYEIDTPMIDLAKMIGEKGAVKCYKEGVKSLHILENLVREEGLDGGFRLKKSLQVSHSEGNIPNLKEEFLMREKHGFGVTWLSSEELREKYRMNSHAGILSDEGASIDAFLFTHELLYKNHQRGLRIFDHTPIKKIQYGNKVEIQTESGYRVICKRIIFCTGYETLSMFRRKYADIVTTFACVSEQDPNLYDELKDLLIWDTDNPYIYMRTTDDNRLLIGGEDIPYRYSGVSDRIKSRKTERLIRKTRKLFPSLRFMEDYHWAGAFGVTKDGLPYIGEHPDYKNAIFVLGFGGNGITFSVQGMKLVLKILAHEYDSLLFYYRLNR
jgi:Glycine/D-amino acid oxidases (deaminating)